MLTVAKSLAAHAMLEYLDTDPERNIPRLLHAVEMFDHKGVFASQTDKARAALEDTNSNWYQLARSAWTNIDAGVRKRIVTNFLVNASLIGYPIQEEMKSLHDCNIPWAILMDPTSACNLNCVGCWAAEYGGRLNLDLETLDSIVEQGKRLGTYMYLFSGGEPLVRKRDIIALCERHPECVFLAFTNGTLIDEEFAQELLRVRNFIPAISVEGFEAETDSRRGKGTYSAVKRAMKILQDNRLPFGISCCYTRQNTETIGSAEFIDDMISSGAMFAWFFTYMPVGADAVPELIATAEQRAFMYRQIRHFRTTKPIFTMDFWNDGEYVNGCIAGGKSYLHINANGDYEPCAFIHYSDSNVRDTTLLEALKRPLFQQYRAHQPFNANHLRPCPLLDNEGALAQIVRDSGADSTDLISPEDVGDLTAKCATASASWAPVAGALWSDSHPDAQGSDPAFAGPGKSIGR